MTREVSLLGRLFRRPASTTESQPIGQASTDQTSTTQSAGASKALDGSSTVAAWLEDPVGGAILRDMLRQAGQNERALRPVRRLSMNRLITLSQGKFTPDMLKAMIEKVCTGSLASQMTIQAASETVSNQRSEPETVWQERICPDRFSGKTVIVTGAGSGIGRATASRLLREGGKVIAVDISAERLEALTSDMATDQLVVVAGDITDDSTITAIMTAAGDTIDGLANVAGIMDNMTPLHEVSDEVWKRVFAVNVEGLMKLSRAVIPIMLQQGRGSIVNVASEALLRGSAAGVAYTASKHAVVGITKSSAFMYAESGLRTNAVAPGPVLTNIRASFDSRLGEERVTALLANAPLAVEPEVLAASISFLLSDDAVNLNGVILPSDGGWSAQ